MNKPNSDWNIFTTTKPCCDVDLHASNLMLDRYYFVRKLYCTSKCTCTYLLNMIKIGIGMLNFLRMTKWELSSVSFILQEDFVVTRGFSITLNAYRQQLQVQNKLTHMSNQFFLKYRNGIILCMALQVMFQCTVYADVNVV